MISDDNVLWWLMVGTGVGAAALSIGASVLRRSQHYAPYRRTQFLLHMGGYVMMSISILLFVLRGLLLP